MDKMGIQGLSYYKYDLSLCTYCSGMTRTILAAIAKAWKGEPWDDVEILSGKVMTPSPEKRKQFSSANAFTRPIKTTRILRK